MSTWKISEELTDENHIVIDLGTGLGCIMLERTFDAEVDMIIAKKVSYAPDLMNKLKECANLITSEIIYSKGDSTDLLMKEIEQIVGEIEDGK